MFQFMIGPKLGRITFVCSRSSLFGKYPEEVLPLKSKKFNFVIIFHQIKKLW